MQRQAHEDVCADELEPSPPSPGPGAARKAGAGAGAGAEAEAGAEHSRDGGGKGGAGGGGALLCVGGCVPTAWLPALVGVADVPAAVTLLRRHAASPRLQACVVHARCMRVACALHVCCTRIACVAYAPGRRSRAAELFNRACTRNVCNAHAGSVLRAAGGAARPRRAAAPPRRRHRVWRGARRVRSHGGAAAQRTAYNSPLPPPYYPSLPPYTPQSTPLRLRVHPLEYIP